MRGTTFLPAWHVDDFSRSHAPRFSKRCFKINISPALCGFLSEMLYRYSPCWSQHRIDLPHFSPDPSVPPLFLPRLEFSVLL